MNPSNSYLRQHIADVSERLIEAYRALKDERRRLDEQVRHQPDSILSSVGIDLEVFPDDVEGLAGQIVKYGKIREPQVALEFPNQTYPFESDEFMEWFNSDAKSYPKIRQYFEQADYLLYLVRRYVSAEVKGDTAAP